MSADALIIRPFRGLDIADVTRIVVCAFPHKWGRLARHADDVSKAEIIQYFNLVSSTPYPGYYVAELNKQVVGVIELDVPGFSKGKRTFPLIGGIMRFGVASTIRILMASIVLGARNAPCDAIYVEHLAVKEGLFGAGIGSALLSKTLEIARQQGVENIHLSVAAINERAMRLYKRFGFTVHKEDVSDVSAYFLGIDHWLHMVCSVS